MSFFETGMLLCFGASWPFAVYKTWKAKTNKGKSLIFLWLVLIGYGCGVVHKLLYSRDIVISIYLLNATLVAADIVLCVMYARRNKMQPAA